MNTSIVLTVIAEDRPGIVRTVSQTLKDHGGNWTQSSMSSLAGQFAGILMASVPSENTEACLAELRGLESAGLRVIANVSSEKTSKEQTSNYTLNLIGNDHPGIVHDITTLLADHNVSVHDLETSVEGASMGGGDIFKALAQLVVPETTDMDTLQNEIEDLANDLMVDINFEH